ncbi:MAG TPA: ISLre2 family transposase [Candidatus Ligilactobacillus excrementavium]|nr:ISLre2 family transposase [Candidatus Ligilactobacillus excrementavium]
MNILQQMVAQLWSDFTKNGEKVLYQESSFDDWVENTMTAGRELCLNLIKLFLEEADRQFKQSEIRKRKFTIKAIRETTKSTLYGDLTLKRTYYQNRETKEYFFLLDNLLSWEKYSRMTLAVKAQILENVAEHTYQEAIEMIPHIGIHSKTTVMKIVHHEGRQLPNSPALPERSERKAVKTLFIEADEDHVAYQDSRNRFMKLVYVHEGYDLTDPRHPLINPHYFTGNYLGSDNEELWTEVLDYIEAHYQLEQIYLSGDGAKWIRNGADFIPDCKFILDRFHLRKYCKKASVGIAGMDRTLYHWALGGETDFIQAYFKVRLSDSTVTVSQRQSLKQAELYLANNATAIKDNSLTDYHGCSAEGHISHYLSRRLSSRPLGWSLVGAQSVARVRIFKLNGGHIASYLQERQLQAIQQEKAVKLDRRLNVRKNIKNKYYEAAQAAFSGHQRGQHSLWQRGIQVGW